MRLAVLQDAGIHLLPADPSEVMEGLTEFDATFTAWDARAVALEHSTGVLIDQASPLRELRDTGQVLRLADDNGTTGQAARSSCHQERVLCIHCG